MDGVVVEEVDERADGGVLHEDSLVGVELVGSRGLPDRGCRDRLEQLALFFCGESGEVEWRVGSKPLGEVVAGVRDVRVDDGQEHRVVARERGLLEQNRVWLVDGQAREGVDYQLDKLKWLWDVTSIADKVIINENQQGVNSRYYRPGPYSPMEQQTRSFTEWYLRELGAGLPT